MGEKQTEAALKKYNEIKKKQQQKYKKQADFLRNTLGITTIEKAVDFMRDWIQTQKFTGGVMKGELCSVMLTCAILGQAIEPNEDRDIAMKDATVGWNVYFALKDEGLW